MGTGNRGGHPSELTRMGTGNRNGHPADLTRMGTGNRNGSSRGGGAPVAEGKSSSFRVRSVKAWRRPDEEVDLPLDKDALAPALKDHTISQPSQGDLHYILNRWGDRWAADREQQHRKQRAAAAMAQNDEEEEMWDLDQFGAPTFGPGL